MGFAQKNYNSKKTSKACDYHNSTYFIAKVVSLKVPLPLQAVPSTSKRTVTEGSLEEKNMMKREGRSGRNNADLILTASEEKKGER